MPIWSWVATAFLIGISPIHAADPFAVDEATLFADSTSVVDRSTADLNSGADLNQNKSISFSGNILSLGQVGLSRKDFSNSRYVQANFSALSLVGLSLDLRLMRGYKAFATWETRFDPGISNPDSSLAWSLPEAFLDANINHQIYFRAGKQVLQWGRCYFFNPTDLINIDRNTFFRRIGSREGAYGLKMHVPFGATYNLYGFLDMRRASRVDSLAAAIKAEALFGRVEIGLMAWNKGHGDPVFGVDLSTRWLSLDVLAEASIHSTYRGSELDFSGVTPKLRNTRRDWVPRAAIGLGRAFDIGGFPNRLNVHGEYFYNRPGITSSKVPLADLAEALEQVSGVSASSIISQLYAAGLYQPNQLSRHYGALFASFSRFILSDLTLTFNAIENLSQNCAQLSGGLSYADLNDFKISLTINGFVGPNQTEYTITDQGLQTLLIAEINF